MSKARDIASAIPAPSTVSSAELGYLDGVTSAIQTQIDSKIGSASAINPTIVDAKGDIIAATAADTVAKLAVGANGTVLTAASGQATGLEWATPGASANFTEVNSGGTNLTGASTITISGITNANFLQVIVHQASSANASSDITMKINADGGSNYYRIGNIIPEEATNITAMGSLTNDSLFLTTLGASVDDYVSASVTIIGGNSAGRKVVNVNGVRGAGYGGSKGSWSQGQWIGSATISSISILSSSGNFDGGKVYVYASA